MEAKMWRCEMQDVGKAKGGAVVVMVGGGQVETCERCLQRVKRLSHGRHQHHPSTWLFRGDTVRNCQGRLSRLVWKCQA